MHIYTFGYCCFATVVLEQERAKDTRQGQNIQHITSQYESHAYRHTVLNITQQQNKSKEEYTPSAWNRLTDTQTNDIIISFDLRKKIARSYISTILLKDFGFAQDLPSQLILLFSTRHNSLSNSTVDTYSTLLIVVCRRN